MLKILAVALTIACIAFAIYDRNLSAGLAWGCLLTREVREYLT